MECFIERLHMSEKNKTKAQLIDELGKIRKRVRKLEDLADKLNSFEKAIETMQIGVTITDLKGKIIYTNPAEAKMHGHTVKALIGKNVRILAPKNIWNPLPVEKLASMGSWRRESINIRKDNAIFPVELKSDIVSNTDGLPVGIITTCEDITERKEFERKTQDLILTDELTGLYNRRGFFTLSEHQLEIIKRQETKAYMFYADLDHLKEINDTFGHQEGDKVLIETAGILRTTYRKSDIIARIGGDEFVVFPVGVGAVENSINIILTRLQKNLEIHNTVKNQVYTLSITTGIACYDPESPCSIDDLVALADKAMYVQKKQKKKS
jgi:diguanylate cyclase (GGDEF)-like protein/PAS domain S-box-containing protein